MKKTLLLVLATALTAAPAMALDVNGEAFISWKNNSNTGVNNAPSVTGNEFTGTDVDRFRVFLSHKFDDTWAFKGRFSMAQGTTGLSFTIPEAMFVGSGLFMAGDTFKMGVQEMPISTAEGQFGWRWITKTFGDIEGFTNTATTTVGATTTPGGISYGMKFGSAGVTLFTAEAEVAEQTGSNDNTKTNGVYVDYKINDQAKVWAQSSTQLETGVANNKSITVMGLGASYSMDMVDAMFNYYTQTFTQVDGAAEVKANKAMGLAANWKKLGGSQYNLYTSYTAGYDAYADAGGGTAEKFSSKMKIGPNWALADGKLNMGVFYDMETFNSDYKTATPNDKEGNILTVQLAAKF